MGEAVPYFPCKYPTNERGGQMTVIKYTDTNGKRAVWNSSNCGACGLFFNETEADEQGFHSVKFCDAAPLTCLKCGTVNDDADQIGCSNCMKGN